MNSHTVAGANGMVKDYASLEKREYSLKYLELKIHYNRPNCNSFMYEINDIRIMDFSFPYFTNPKIAYPDFFYEIFGKLSNFKRIDTIVYSIVHKEYTYNLIEKYDKPLIIWKGISNIEIYSKFLCEVNGYPGKQLSKHIDRYMNSIEKSFFEMSINFFESNIENISKKFFIKKLDLQIHKKIKSHAWFSTLSSTDIKLGEGTLKSFTFSNKMIALTKADMGIGNHQKSFDLLYCFQSKNWMEFYKKIIELE